MPKIYVDADGCPVIDKTIKVAQALHLDVTLICDTSHEIIRDGAKTITVTKGIDAVDFALVNRISKGDIVVTQDYGLAAMVLAKQSYCINQNGRYYTPNNISGLLEMRHLSKKVRRAGGRMKGPRKRQKEQDIIFEQKFTELCKKAIQREQEERERNSE